MLNSNNARLTEFSVPDALRSDCYFRHRWQARGPNKSTIISQAFQPAAVRVHSKKLG
jgi:hypothetical protein